MKNYYEELEISKTASQEVIEKVYKVLAKKYHPDMNQGANKEEAEEKFKKISEAYEILSNEEKRKKYDLELEQNNPSISYEDYMSVINERNELNNTLINMKNEFYNLKNSNSRNTTSNQNQTKYQQNYNNVNSNFQSRNTTSNQNMAENYNTNSNKRTYYYTSTGKPASAFDYFKYRIKEFFSNIVLIVLFIILIVFVLNAFLPFNLFSLFIK